MDCVGPASWTRPGYGAGKGSHGGLRFGWSRGGVVRDKLGGGGVNWRRGRRDAVVRCGGGGERREKSAVIVGAGPAGALLALLLARQDWKVDVFERKQWSDGSWAPGQPDGWNVMLGARAAYCLEEVGLKEDVWGEGVLCSGRSAIAGGGLKPKYQSYGYELLAIPQPKLASVLINTGMRKYSGKIAYNFGWALQSLHPEDSVAEFCPSDESHGSDAQSKIVVRADLVVGADGLHSRTRAELEAKAAGFRSTLHSVPAGRHIRLRVPVDVVGEQVDEAGNRHGPSLLVVARRAKLMWGVPNRDGTMGLTLQGIQGSTAADVSSEMQEAFPELSEFFNADGEASARLAAAPERVQGTVTATSYNYKQTVLLGDAAHSLLNVTHLGAGLALEDCLVLDRLLQSSFQSEDDVTTCISSALSSFSNERIPEMAAAAQLCSEVSRTNMFQVELQRAILRVVTRFIPRIQPWQKAANTQVVSAQQLVKWRAREILIVRVALLFAMVLLLMRAIRLVRLAFKVMTPMAKFLQR
ncbi:hypothetical protein M758_1G303700 [Ceratodon purpureus]|nr:hypothetical protein M758_1G303700 [Ceratodon purpureus]